MRRPDRDFSSSRSRLKEAHARTSPHILAFDGIANASFSLMVAVNYHASRTSTLLLSPAFVSYCKFAPDNSVFHIEPSRARFSLFLFSSPRLC